MSSSDAEPFVLRGSRQPTASAAGVQTPKAISDEWLTPPELLRALGHFDLDPCSPTNRPWATASRHLTVRDDGLSQPWAGRVFLNPPYGPATAKWLARLADHGNGIALVFARTETAMFFEHVWPKADALLFIRGRIHFHHADGRRAHQNSGAPSVLIAYGRSNIDALRSIDGHLVVLANSPAACQPS